MTDNSMRDMMQQALDGELSPEHEEELLTHLDRDEDAAQEFDRLRRIDRMLRRTSTRRAPDRLAVTIMARLAESMEAKLQQEDLPESTQQMIMASLSLVMAMMHPMMVAASWMVLNTDEDPDVFTELTVQSVALLYLMIDAMKALMQDLEQMVHDDPEVAKVALSLIPFMLEGMLDYLEDAEQFTEN